MHSKPIRLTLDRKICDLTDKKPSAGNALAKYASLDESGGHNLLSNFLIITSNLLSETDQQNKPITKELQ